MFRNNKKVYYIIYKNIIIYISKNKEKKRNKKVFRNIMIYIYDSQVEKTKNHPLKNFIKETITLHPDSAIFIIEKEYLKLCNNICNRL